MAEQHGWKVQVDVPRKSDRAVLDVGHQLTVREIVGRQAICEITGGSTPPLRAPEPEVVRFGQIALDDLVLTPKSQLALVREVENLRIEIVKLKGQHAS